MKDNRKNIDKIDEKISSLLLERLKEVKAIGKFKKEKKIDVLDENRQKEILERITKDLNEEEKEYMEEIYGQIFISSQKIEK